MSATVPVIEPEFLVAGLSAIWKIYLSDYLPSDGWTLKYSLKKSGVAPLNISSSSTSDDYHQVSLTAATTALYTTGDYLWQSYVEHTDGSKYLITTGNITIRAFYGSLAAGTDVRTHAVKVLDAIKAVIEGRASYNQSSVKVGDKELRYYTFTELLYLKEYYEGQVLAEQQENGEATDSNSYYAEFTRDAY